MKLPSKNPTIHALLNLLDAIERDLRAENLWKDTRSQGQDEWLPLEEWIKFIMIPRDRASLLKSEIPLNFQVGDMALCDLEKIPDTKNLTKLLIEYQKLLEKHTIAP